LANSGLTIDEELSETVKFALHQLAINAILGA
jgi:hypothetical protein